MSVKKSGFVFDDILGRLPKVILVEVVLSSVDVKATGRLCMLGFMLIVHDVVEDLIVLVFGLLVLV